MAGGLGELEFAIMSFVWDHGGSVTVPDVHEHLLRRPGKKLAYTTVMTVMTRLYEKRLLRRSESRRPYSYEAAVDREEYFANRMLETLAGIDDRNGVLARFVDGINRRDAESLRKLLAKTRKARS